MKIGLIGDIHGRVFHTLAVVTAWQMHHNVRLDLLIQVGDLGAYPEPDESLRNHRFYRQDPSQLDFSRLIHAEAEKGLPEDLRLIRNMLSNPIYFIRGNHEDFAWLDRQAASGSGGVSSIDPYDLFRYVQDGTVLQVGGTTIGFLGGIETVNPEDEREIDQRQYKRLFTVPPQEIDILITHDTPYGVGTNYYGETQGSNQITALVERLQPKYLIAGHYHHVIGPRKYGNTTYLGLNVIMNLRRDNASSAIEPGWLVILDTEKDELAPVEDEWLAGFGKHFHFHDYCANLRTIHRP
ncbi:metallophosphoesterase [Paenibacillus allorhizosphaerae]|uniref:Calcineurin-like phosphoesterase domain-containing protein n=1 Tax=Paenibacillus allorhizosphaerae TaxID=2849866 RepID=A0ABN7TI27_9BACL|nr:metallophosphoesterase [Paenibacillus allorhizosphaerae]CAG7628081.1 hypothetical protein PAECIP111802_01419 [Paenibacillus allorhizosphaerae]